MDRKRELKRQYMQTQLPMGIFIIRSKTNNKYLLQTAENLPGVMNGARVRLAAGMHPNRELQKEWQEYGADNFTIEILENLEPNTSEAVTDYSEDLALMQMIWEEKLAKDKLEAYKKRL